MLFYLVLFGVSLVAMVAMLAWRAWQIRTGKVQVLDRTGEHVRIPPLRTYVRRETLLAIRKKAHIAIIYVIKFWVIGTHLGGKAIRKRAPKVHAFFSRKPNLPASHTVSALLRHAGEYKRKMKKFKQKLREHDETATGGAKDYSDEK